MGQGRAVERVERPDAGAADVEEQAIGDDRRAAAGRLAPAGDQLRRAAGLHDQLQARDAGVVGDEHPAAAVRRIGPRRRLRQHLTALRNEEVLELAADVSRPALTAQVVEVEQPQVAVLPTLHREVREPPARRAGQQDRGHAPEVAVALVEELEVGGGVGVERFAVVARAVRAQGQHAVAPVVSACLGVEEPVAGGEEDAIELCIVDHPRP